MLKRYSSLLVVMAIALACSKDKLETKPSIKIKSVNATELPRQMDLIILLEFRDKEGDLGNGLLTYLRERLNVYYPALNDLADSVSNPIPDFPKTSQGEIQVVIPADLMDQNSFQNDTMQFKILVHDLGGNISDTITTPVIVQLQD